MLLLRRLRNWWQPIKTTIGNFSPFKLFSTRRGTKHLKLGKGSDFVLPAARSQRKSRWQCTPRRFIALFLVTDVLLLLFLRRNRSNFSPRSSLPSFNSSTHHSSSRQWNTRVGPRSYPDLYRRSQGGGAGRGCNASEFLDAVARARIKDVGPSKFGYVPPPGVDDNTLDLDSFRWSYELEGCPQPHIFTSAEACDLINAFGGVYTRGDSLMRQFTTGLYILLTGSFDLVREHKEDCIGNRLFTNGYTCKFYSIYDSAEMSHVCDENPFVVYDQVWKFTSRPSYPPTSVPRFHVQPHRRNSSDLTKPEEESDPSNNLVRRQHKLPPDEPDFLSPLPMQQYDAFLSYLPEYRRSYSPIFVHSTGIHYNWDTNLTVFHHILPFSHSTSLSHPRPLSTFNGYPAPGTNKPVAHLVRQGPTATKRHNAAMARMFEELNDEELEVGEGAWGFVDWYNSTDGALSYDGTHYSYQVAMERAQIFLNLLDILWGDIVEHGGLVAGEEAA